MDESLLTNEFNTLMQSMQELMKFTDEQLTDEVLKVVMMGVEQQFSPMLVEQSVNQIIQNFEEQGLTKEDANNAMQALSETLKETIYGQNELHGNKKILIDKIINHLFDIFQMAVEKYHSYAIELPITVDTAAGAKVPTYAHETDAAADLYAMVDQNIPAYSRGNKINTGVRIQLPEGWLAMILPRSSMGTKTGLRLSNSVGLIDSGYRGELGILYDNISNETYHITAGDRIAQLLVMPSYRFKANVVDILADSDRGEGGFGASGK